MTLQKYNIKDYSMTPHFIERVQERFNVGDVEQWLQNYPILIKDTYQDTPNGQTRIITVAPDGTTIIIDTATHSLITAYKGLRPDTHIPILIDSYKNAIDCFIASKNTLLANYSKEYKSHIENISNQFNEFITPIPTASHLEQLETAYTSIHNLKKHYDVHTKPLTGQIKLYQQRINDLEETLDEIKSLTPIVQVIDNDDFFDDFDNWALVDNLSVGLNIDEPSAELDVDEEPVELDDIYDILQVDFNQNVYANLNRNDWTAFVKELRAMYSTAKVDIERLKQVLKTTPVNALSPELKKIRGIGDGRKKQIIELVNRYLNEYILAQDIAESL